MAVLMTLWTQLTALTCLRPLHLMVPAVLAVAVLAAAAVPELALLSVEAEADVTVKVEKAPVMPNTPLATA
jgi:hypothetical protein